MTDMQNWSYADAFLACDCCLKGCGAWLEGKYFHCKYPDFIFSMKLPINVLELLTIAVSVKLWGSFSVTEKL